ncbi:Protein kinase-like domain protein [Niveomyces insectorum RCEF 264]|uniref:EKC/KEOPS complex subunit BUD32 n=1 Tax=Niveomyces insectorum RCEF 264 TaxID=1081102 RepID=A0A167LW08_9HYPO|nr:Protein kinase-like domain protein [Niveomyces insectorum RCEF 264]
MATPLFPGKELVFGTILGMGGSCFVSYIDEHTVYKGYEIRVNGRRKSYYPISCEEDLAREFAVYQHLGPHDCILRCYGLDVIHDEPPIAKPHRSKAKVPPPPAVAVHALRLELAPHGTVRDLIQKKLPGSPLPLPARLRLCRDVAAAVAHTHSRGVWHQDLSCRNFLLFPGTGAGDGDGDGGGDCPYPYRAKLGDFGGSIIQGREDEFPTIVGEEPQYMLPNRGRADMDDRPLIKRELFALGCCLYEIMAWRRPHQGQTDSEVAKQYERGEFPSLKEEEDGRGDIPAAVAKAIDGCWNEVYDSADRVLAILENVGIGRERPRDDW